MTIRRAINMMLGFVVGWALVTALALAMVHSGGGL
jgi:hypothetical protein